MNTNRWDEELTTAIEAAFLAAEICRAVRLSADPATLTKRDSSPVTVADFASQALICRQIKAHFPDDLIVAEEAADALREADAIDLLAEVHAHAEYFVEGVDAETVCDWIDAGGARQGGARYWTVDPIDGTKGFVRNEQYAVAIGLIVDGVVRVAALACPNLHGGRLYSAVEGGGARRSDLEGGDPALVRVSDCTDLSAARFCESVESGHSSHNHAARIAERLGIVAEPLRIDSQCKYAAVADGMAEVYLRLPTRVGYVEKIWDHAAGAALLREAGGRVTDVTGAPLCFDGSSELHTNRGIVATSGPMHDRVVEAVQAVLGD